MNGNTPLAAHVLLAVKLRIGMRYVGKVAEEVIQEKVLRFDHAVATIVTILVNLVTDTVATGAAASLLALLT